MGKATKIMSRDGKETGIILNPRAYRCRMEGCGGWRMYVRWSNGKKTFPCTKGCRCVDAETLRII